MNKSLCFSCMETIDFPEAVCPECGYDNRIRSNGAGMLGGGILGGKYLVGRMLGRGGFGATYLGYDMNVDRKVALKEYFPSHLVMRHSNSITLSALSGCEGEYNKGRERAIREGKMAAGLGQIPGVVQVFDVFSCNNTVYIAMEYIDGCTLAEFVARRSARLSLQESMNLMAPVAQALMELHRRRVIHRDVKPENIMIRSHNYQAVLLDFGAAKEQTNATLSNSSAVVSPGFAPPEQYSASSLDGRIDQYAFAATMYFILTGKRPPDVMIRMATGNPLPSIRNVNPGIPSAVENAINKAMSIKPESRFGSVEEFWNALINVLMRSRKTTRNMITQPGTGVSAPQAENKEKKMKTSGVAKIAAVAVGLAIIGIGGEMAFNKMNKGQEPKINAAISPGILIQETDSVTATPRPMDEFELYTPTPVPQTPGISEEEYEYITLSDGSYEIVRYKGNASEVTIPAGVSSIGNGAFNKINGLVRVVIPEGVTQIGPQAFSYCRELQSVVLPSTLQEISSYAFNWCINLTDIRLPEQLKILGEGAFSHCRALQEVNLPASIAAIGDDVFQDCASLNHVEAAKGSTAESYCKEYALPTGEATAQTAPSEKTLKDYEYEVLPDGAIQLTKYIGKETEVVVPEGVTHIGDDVFRDCSTITRITLPSSVTHIGKYAFAYCGNLEQINLPENLQHLGDYAMWDCNSLNNVVIPASLTDMGENPFGACESLVSLTVSADHPSLKMENGVLFDHSQNKLVYYPVFFTAESYEIPQGVEIIGDYAFSYNRDLTSVRIPGSVRTIGGRAFLSCKKLSNVELPGGVQSIGVWAFGECSSLISMEIPSSVKTIGALAFSECPALKTVTIPAQVETIGERVFENCPALSYVMVTADSPAEQYCIDNQLPYRLMEASKATPIEDFEYKVLSDGSIEINKYLGEETEVIIPASVSRIGDKAFYTCQTLVSVTIPEGVSHIGDYAFWDCNRLKKINIPLSLETIGENPFGACDSLEELDVSKNHTVVELVDGVLFDKTENRLVCYPYTFTSASYQVPDGTVVIGDYAFSFCSDLVEVKIPDSVTRIGARAFLGCMKLKTAKIPDGVTRIGMRAFAQCGNLTTVTIPASVKYIEDKVFDECAKLEKIIVEKGSAAERYCIENDLPYEIAK